MCGAGALARGESEQLSFFRFGHEIFSDVTAEHHFSIADA